MSCSGTWRESLRENSRDADTPARYGGEEMALILPHTDMEGSHAIAERVRSAIAGLRISRLDGQGTLRITASLGVAASSEGVKDATDRRRRRGAVRGQADGQEQDRQGVPANRERDPDPSSLWAMGLLDDAIREHLDLKRRRGADPAEIERAERDALGPVRRDPVGSGEAEIEHAAMPDGNGGYEEESAYDHGFEEPPQFDAPVAPASGGGRAPGGAAPGARVHARSGDRGVGRVRARRSGVG